MVASVQAGHVVGGRYRLVAELGAGGFGRVWRAHDDTLGVDVAIKELRLPPGVTENEHAARLARAIREARNAARLRSHPNIVAIHDVVLEGELPWIVMELIDGRSLEDHLRDHGPLPVGQVERVAASVLAALDAAHREGVVHRDVKPGNVLLAADGRVLLTDFGIAVHADDTTLTTTRMFIGSPEYTAPERLHGDDDPAGDLFSLGATLYHAVEGVSPFRRTTQAATITAVLMEQPRPPARAGHLTPLITGLLSKDPGRRPRTVEPATAPVAPRGGTRMLTRVEHAQPRTWHMKGVAVIAGFTTLLGIVGLTAPGPGWSEIVDFWDAPRNYHDGGWAAPIAIGLAVIAGALSFGAVAHTLLRRAGWTVTVLLALIGPPATCMAFDGGTKVLWWTTTLHPDEAAAISLGLVTVLLLLAAGWTIEGWRARRSGAGADQLR